MYHRLKRQLAPKSLTLQAKEVNQPQRDELLKRPTSSEPSTSPKGLLLYPLVIHFSVGFGDIRKVDVAARYVLIPLKHGIDRHAKLNRILLIDVAGVYPEILQSISGSLLRAELYLLPPSLALPCAGFCVLKANFLLSPGVRKYCVGRDIAASRFAEDDLAIGFPLQEAYESHGRFASDLRSSVTRATRSAYRRKVCYQRSIEWNQMSKD